MNYYSEINGKPGLLITLGCSWTSGVGSYDTGCLEQFKRGEISHDELYATSYYNGSFYKGSWPKFLAELLNYDLINLGTSGDSNSASAKRLILECDETQTFKSLRGFYKQITVLWLLTETSRFSFYSNRQLTSFNNNHSGKIFMDYINEVYKNEQDGNLETKFYLKSVESYCNSNAFDFIYGSAFVANSALKNLYDSDKNVHQYLDKPAMADYLDFSDSNIVSHCFHPTLEGYKIIANMLFKTITENFKGRA